MTPLRTEAGHWVFVNRGFVPPELRGRVPRPEGALAVTGLLRPGEPGGNLLQQNQPAEHRWYSRDVAAMAAARGLQGPVAPFFVDAQAAAGSAATWPRAGLTVLKFPNNHLGYALTWFTLAAMVAGAVGYLLLDERRLRAKERSLADRPA
jgi:surfeit locus 1 family protein